MSVKPGIPIPRPYTPRAGSKLATYASTNPDAVVALGPTPKAVNWLELNNDGGLGYMFNGETGTFKADAIGERFGLRVSFAVVSPDTLSKALAKTLAAKLPKTEVTGLEFWWDISEQKDLTAPPSFVALGGDVATRTKTTHVMSAPFFTGANFVPNDGVLKVRTTTDTLLIKNLSLFIYEGG